MFDRTKDALQTKLTLIPQAIAGKNLVMLAGVHIQLLTDRIEAYEDLAIVKDDVEDVTDRLSIISDKVTEEVVDETVPDGKKKYSNETARKAEVKNRLSANADWNKWKSELAVAKSSVADIEQTISAMRHGIIMCESAMKSI